MKYPTNQPNIQGKIASYYSDKGMLVLFSKNRLRMEDVSIKNAYTKGHEKMADITQQINLPVWIKKYLAILMAI